MQRHRIGKGAVPFPRPGFFRPAPFLLLLCLLLALPTFSAHGQEDPFDWTLRLGQKGETTPTAMAPAPSGGVFIVGGTNGEEGHFGDGYGKGDAFILRVSEGGDILWQHRLGGSGEDVFTHVIPTEDGGVIAMGSSDSSDGHARAPRGGKDAFLARFSPDGELLFTKNLGGTQDDELLDTALMPGGDVAVCGRTMSFNHDLPRNNGGFDAWVAMLSGVDGHQLWMDRYGDGGDDAFIRLLPTGDDLLVLGTYGEATDHEAKENAYEDKPIVMLYDDGGDREWVDPLALGGTGVNRLVDALETDGGFILLGETDSRSAFMPQSLGRLDIWLLQLRRSGTVSWQRRLGGSGTDQAHALLKGPKDGYMILGETDSRDGQVTGAHGSQDGWVAAVTANGQLTWQQTLGGSQASSVADFFPITGVGTLVLGSTLAQDGDMGKHPSVRAGFLAMLGLNGNLLYVGLIGGGEECTLTSLCTDGLYAYALGSLRTLVEGALVEDLFLAKLSIVYYGAPM